MIQLSKPRIRIDEPSAVSFVDSLEHFYAQLSPAERAILSALIHAAMDPWSRALVDPPALSADEAAALESALTSAAETP